MNKFTAWLRAAGDKIVSATQRFMSGRYGHDRLNMTMLIAGLVLCILQMFAGNGIVALVLNLIANVLLVLVLFRCFSRNTYKRYQENRRYLLLVDQIKDRQHRYYSCPKCRQTVRVPKGKGKIAITCPKCREKFVKKT